MNAQATFVEIIFMYCEYEISNSNANTTMELKTTSKKQQQLLLPNSNNPERYKGRVRNGVMVIIQWCDGDYSYKVKFIFFKPRRPKFKFHRTVGLVREVNAELLIQNVEE